VVGFCTARQGAFLTADVANLRNREFCRILLIKLSAVGDVVHTFPFLNRLRRHYPAARVDWVIKPAIAELVRHHPAIDNVVLYPQDASSHPWQMGWSAVAAGRRLIAELRSVRYELVIDLHGQLRTATLALATGAPQRIGFDRPRARVWRASARKLPSLARKHAWQGAREGSWLAYTHRLSIPTLDMHAVDRYLRFGSMLGLAEDGVDFSFAIPDSSVARTDHLLREHFSGFDDQRLAVIAPGTIWETKHWSSEGFAEVARHLMRKNLPVVLIGSKRERAVCQQVANAALGAVNLAGVTTLSELAAIIRRATICITNDSGPMHLAVALNRPVVSIFGPTDSLWIGPYRQPGSVLSAALACSPCYLRRLSRCPHHHACMRGIAAEEVIDRVEAILASENDRSAASVERTRGAAGAQC
jgi:lipopolysaccharide heptosyltransferase I